MAGGMEQGAGSEASPNSAATDQQMGRVGRRCRTRWFCPQRAAAAAGCCRRGPSWGVRGGRASSREGKSSVAY